MENASKALIIAGAILLAILIIGLGIYIYNQASNSVSDTGMDKIAVRQFNGQFEPYLDKVLSSIEAKSLIDTAKNAGVTITEGEGYLSTKTDIGDNQCEAKASYIGESSTTKIKEISITKYTAPAGNTTGE